jgi:hypothetical protein
MGVAGYAVATASEYATIMTMFVTLSVAALMWLAGEAGAALRDLVRNSFDKS